MTAPPPSPAALRVAFCVLGYNQERYIRPAIEAALAQDHPGLDIILSDDCSGDATFAIMQRMAQAYRGPHRVRARRNPRNIGTLAHLLQVARAAQGDLMIVAAGDDISLPDRTQATIAAFAGAGVLAVSGDDIVIDVDGVVRPWDAGRGALRAGWHRERPAWVHGATAAYDLPMLQSLPMPDEPVLYEDMTLIDVIACLGGRSARLTRPLIRYRYHDAAVSDRLRPETSILATEAQCRQRWQRAVPVKRYALQAMAARDPAGLDAPALRRIAVELRLFRLLARWQRGGVGVRARLLLHGIARRDPSALIRAFGVPLFVAVKWLQGRIAARRPLAPPDQPPPPPVQPAALAPPSPSR